MPEHHLRAHAHNRGGIEHVGAVAQDGVAIFGRECHSGPRAEAHAARLLRARENQQAVGAHARHRRLDLGG